jgi:acetylornithine deacetylase
VTVGDAASDVADEIGQHGSSSDGMLRPGDPTGEPMDDLLDLLAQLVAVDTTTRRSNLELIDWVEDRIAEVADTTWRVANDAGDKANLIARFGPDVTGGVVLSGHTDCVPVDGQAWTSDPFTMRRDDDRVFGRGTCDMKGFLACCLTLVPRLAAADLREPVWFAFSYDEEIGALGAAPLVESMVSAGASPEAVIVGEPTSLGIVNAHKSIRSFTITVTGRGGHSSRPEGGANAIAAIARIATFIGDLAERETGVRDETFDPPYTTFNLGMIQGGTAINIIPDRAELTWEYRALPDEDGPHLADEVERFAREEVLPDLRRTAPEADIAITSPGVLPALHREDDGAAERLVRELTGTDEPARTAPFGTDASRFQAAGWSAVVCGPGSIDVAHRPDEYVDLDQLAACHSMLEGVVARQRR